MSRRHFIKPAILLIIVLCTFSALDAPSPTETFDTFNEALRAFGLPKGLLPKGLTNFTIAFDGRFVAYLDRDCNAKFETQSELHYERTVTGQLSSGSIRGLTGITAQDLFLWFPVLEVRVDVPSSGLINFDLGVVYKEFSVSSFDSPPDCITVTTSLPKVNGGITQRFDEKEESM